MYRLTTAPFCSEFQFSDYIELGRIARYSGSNGSCHYDRRSVSACTLLDDALPPPEHQVSVCMLGGDTCSQTKSIILSICCYDILRVIDNYTACVYYNCIL